MRQEAPIESNGINHSLEAQAQTVFRNFHDRILNGHHPDEITEKDRKSLESLKDGIQTIERNNLIADSIRSDRFNREIREPEQVEAGPCSSAKIHCTDGRILRIQWSFTENTLEALRGEIPTRKPSDQIIPKSAHIGEVLRNPKKLCKSVLDYGLAHFDGVDAPDLGCAAVTNFLDEIRNDPKPYERIFTAQEIESIPFLKPEEANKLLIKRTTSTALTNFVNLAKTAEGYEPLRRVAVEGFIDTGRMGLIFKENGDTLDTSQMTNRSIERIEDLDVANFGDYNKHFTDEHKLFELLRAKKDITLGILQNKNGRFENFLHETEAFANHAWGDFDESQMKRFKFDIAQQVAWQYLTGLSIPQDHPNKRHGEKYMVASADGVFFRYDTEQQFGTSASDPKDGIKQIIVETQVLDHNGLIMDRPRNLFICSSASHEDFESNSEGLMNAKQNLAEFMIAISTNPELKRQMKNGRLIPIPTLIDRKTRKVVRIPDFSPYL